MAKEEKIIELIPGQGYIKLGQLLKYTNIIEKGGDEKSFLSTAKVTVNGNPENRRGAKIRPDDVVEVNGAIVLKVCA